MAPISNLSGPRLHISAAHSSLLKYESGLMYASPMVHENSRREKAMDVPPLDDEAADEADVFLNVEPQPPP